MNKTDDDHPHDSDTERPGQLVHKRRGSRHRLHCIDLLALDRGGGLYSPLSSPAGPAY